MNAHVLQQALEELPNPTGDNSVAQIRKLGKLVDGDLPLQSFLEQLLPELSSVFSGQAAVAWMKAQGAVFGVRYKMDPLLESISDQKKHERLVQLAWQQRQAMLVESAGKRTKQNGSDKTANNESTAVQDASENSTGFPLLFGPVLHLGEPIALLEVVLPKTPQPLTQSQRQLYLRCMKLVAERIYSGLRLRMSMPAATIRQAESHLSHLTDEVQSLQAEIRRTIERQLQQFHGWGFGTLDENQAFAKAIHQLLDSHGLRVECPECGNPAILRCLRAGNAKNGAFVFDHYLDTGRTFHGGPTTVPLIRVVSKPARRTAIPRTSA